MKLPNKSSWRRFLLLLALCTGTVLGNEESRAEPTGKQVQEAMHRAVKFFRQGAAASGGYVHQVSADLQKREGEGKVGPTTAWIQPPGTPLVGRAYLDAYQMCGDEALLDAAKETAAALVRGQLRSGGWDNLIEFDPDDRRRYAYRVEPNDGRQRRNTTTFDDNKSQSVIQFLMRLDQELEFKNAVIHEAVMYALDAVLKSQYSVGAWPQRYTEFPITDSRRIRASIPKNWSRKFPGEKYSGFYTLNDNTTSDLIVLMLDAHDIYQDRRYLEAAERGGEFFLNAQLPEPQPGWAQQYDGDMHPAWARKFEPPAITGGESQQVMRTLMLLYRRTAALRQDAGRFLDPLPRAIAYYRRSELPDGRLARFYELGTNRPLFFAKNYELTYSPDDMPTHYSFIVSSKLEEIESELKKVHDTPTTKLWKPEKPEVAERTKEFDRRVEQILQDLDARGAWVEDGKLRYHGNDDPTREVIRSQTFANNLRTLAKWLAADMAERN